MQVIIMNCLEIKESIHRVAEGCGTPHEQNLVKTHTSECVQCREDLMSLKRMLTLLHDAEVPQKTEKQWQEMHDAIVGQINKDTTIENKIEKNHPDTIRFPTIMRKRIWAIAAGLLLMLSGIGIIFIPKHKNSPTATGKFQQPYIVAMEGDVFTSHQGKKYSESSWNKIETPLVLHPGHSIKTEQKSSAKVQLDLGTGLALASESRLTVHQFDTKSQHYFLEEGTVSVQVRKRTKKQLFKINTPNAECSVIGTRFKVSVDREGSHGNVTTTLMVTEGTVQFDKLQSKETVFVHRGEKVLLSGSDIQKVESSANDIVDSLFLPLQNAMDLQKEFGYLRVTTSPSNAIIEIEGNYAGRSPLMMVKPHGVYTLTVKKEGFEPWVNDITINEDDSGTHHYDVVLQQTKESIEPDKIESKHKQSSDKGVFTKERTLSLNDTMEVAQGVLTKEDKAPEAYNKASAMMNKGQCEEALPILLSVTENPKVHNKYRAAAWNKVVSCYKRLQKYEAALAALQKIVKDYPQSVYVEAAIFNIATINANNLENFGDAIASLNTYIDKYPEGVLAEEAYVMLGEILYLRKEYKEAARVYEQYITYFGDSKQIDKPLYSLAHIYTQNLQNCERAMALYTQLIKEFPSGRYADDATFWRANCLYRTGRISRAIKEYNAYINNFPNGSWITEAKIRLNGIKTAGAK